MYKYSFVINILNNIFPINIYILILWKLSSWKLDLPSLYIRYCNMETLVDATLQVCRLINYVRFLHEEAWSKMLRDRASKKNPLEPCIFSEISLFHLSRLLYLIKLDILIFSNQYFRRKVFLQQRKSKIREVKAVPISNTIYWNSISIPSLHQ